MLGHLLILLPTVSCPSAVRSVQADDQVAAESTFDAIHDTEAFVAANDDVIMAVFRGSQGGRDWLTNLSVLPRDVPQEWKLQAEDLEVHRVGTLAPVVSYITAIVRF